MDGKKVATEKLPEDIAYRMSLDEPLDIGEDTGTPVSEDHKVPFKKSIYHERGITMLYWAIVFLIISIISGLLGFTGIAGASYGIAKILFILFLIVFVVLLIFGRGRARR